MDKSYYRKMALELADLVIKKQEVYGDSFNKSGDILRILFPNGVDVDKYEDLLTVVRIIDKLFRVANNKNAFGESPYLDICGYSLLALVRDYFKGNKNG